MLEGAYYLFFNPGKFELGSKENTNKDISDALNEIYTSCTLYVH